MRWEDERYVRVYTRDTTDFLALSFAAQALFVLLLRKVDRAGILPLGRHGKRGVAIAIGHPREWPMLEPALEELFVDGCVSLSPDGQKLLVPNFIDAQEARSSDKARQQKSRETARDVAAAGDVLRRDTPSHGVTPSHAPSREDHDESHAVTPSLAVPSRAVPNLPPSGVRAPARDVPEQGSQPVHSPAHTEADGESFSDAVDRVHREARGRGYEWTRADDNATRALLGKPGGLTEALRRWDNGIRAQFKQRVDTLSELARDPKWKANADPEPGPGSKPQDARAAADRAVGRPDAVEGACAACGTGAQTSAFGFTWCYQHFAEVESHPRRLALANDWQAMTAFVKQWLSEQPARAA